MTKYYSYSFVFLLNKNTLSNSRKLKPRSKQQTETTLDTILKERDHSIMEIHLALTVLIGVQALAIKYGTISIFLEPYLWGVYINGFEFEMRKLNPILSFLC